MAVDLAFDLALVHGRCVGVVIPGQGDLDDLAGALLDEERACAAGWAPPRRRTWIAGRAALRAALAREGLEAPAALSDDRGAPSLPPGVAGSVSHKETLAVALVAREPLARVGVDVELDVPRRIDVSRKVLREEELADLARLGDAERASQVLLRFSAKEAIYKALDPFVRRYVGFLEVSVRPRDDGGADVQTFLAHGEGPFRVDVTWLRRGDAWITTARVERQPA